MTPEQYETAKQHLLSAFNAVAPNGNAQAALIAEWHEAEAEIFTTPKAEEQILCILASAIIDGLRYGNWPGKNAE